MAGPTTGSTDSTGSSAVFLRRQQQHQQMCASTIWQLRHLTGCVSLGACVQTRWRASVLPITMTASSSAETKASGTKHVVETLVTGTAWRMMMRESHWAAAHLPSQLRPSASFCIQKGAKAVRHMKSRVVTCTSRLSSSSLPYSAQDSGPAVAALGGASMQQMLSPRPGGTRDLSHSAWPHRRWRPGRTWRGRQPAAAPAARASLRP